MKKFICFILLATLLLSFCGCGEDNNQNSKDDTSSQYTQSDNEVSSKQEVSSPDKTESENSNISSVNSTAKEEPEKPKEPEIIEEEDEIKSDALTGLTANGTIDNSPKLTYSAQVELQNRTASSVEMRIRWTTTVGSKSFTYYGQRFKASIKNVDFGTVIVSEYGELSTPNDASQKATAVSQWKTIELDTADETTVDMILYYYQTGPSGNDTTIKQDTSGLDLNWKVTVPAA